MANWRNQGLKALRISRISRRAAALVAWRWEDSPPYYIVDLPDGSVRGWLGEVILPSGESLTLTPPEVCATLCVKGEHGLPSEWL